MVNIKTVVVERYLGGTLPHNILNWRFHLLKKILWIVVALYPVSVVLIMIASAGSDQIILSKGLPLLITLLSLFFLVFMWMIRKRA